MIGLTFFNFRKTRKGIVDIKTIKLIYHLKKIVNTKNKKKFARLGMLLLNLNSSKCKNEDIIKNIKIFSFIPEGVE